MSDYADAWFRTAFEDAAIGMAILSIEGEYLRVNRSLCTILGREAEELLGSSFLDFTHPDDRATATERLHRLADGESLAFEERYVHRDGHTVWAALHVSAMSDASGRPAYLVSQIQDVSARRRMEDALRHAQKMDAVGRLAGGIAHDFNNLLTAARLNADLLHEQIPASDPGRELIEEVRSAIDRAAALTHQLLVVSRRSFTNPTTMDVNDVVRRLVPLLQRLAGRDVVVSATLRPGNAWVHADPGQIEDALLALVAWGRDTIAGTGTIAMSTGGTTVDDPRDGPFGHLAAGRYTTIVVRTSTPPIPQSDLERLFEPFHVFHEGEDAWRSGLGLTAVHSIIAGAGGHVTASAPPEGGTEFTIYLPEL